MNIKPVKENFTHFQNQNPLNPFYKPSDNILTGKVETFHTNGKFFFGPSGLSYPTLRLFVAVQGYSTEIGLTLFCLNIITNLGKQKEGWFFAGIKHDIR